MNLKVSAILWRETPFIVDRGAKEVPADTLAAGTNSATDGPDLT